MKLSKRGPYYWVDFRTPAGKRRRQSTGETEEAAAYVKAGIIVRDAVVMSAPDLRLTLSAALETTYEQHWSRSRSAREMRHTVDLLKRELAGVVVAKANTKELRAHCERWLSQGTAPATVNRRMSAVGVTLARCVEDGDISVRPKTPYYRENNLRERYITVDEDRAIFAALDKRVAAESIMGGNKWQYMRHLTAFLLDTGFRFSEAFKFKVIDGYADLGHGTTKGAGSRTADGRRVPMTVRAKLAAEQMLASEQHKALQAMVGKQPWDWCSHRFGVVTKAAGCPDVTLHVLRHTCASRLVQRNVPIYTVSKWLGHSSAKVTERYAKLAPDTMSTALSALEAT